MDLQRLPSLPEDVAARVRDLAGAAERADGIGALGEQALLSLRDPDAAVRHVVATDGAVLAGYAQVDLGADPAGPASAELVVAPDHRRRGVGGALLDAVRAAAADAGRPGAVVWAHGDLPGAQALARREGLRVVRELWRMSRPLSPDDARSPLPPLPDGVAVRPFVVGRDEDAWVEVNARAFASHPEQGRLRRGDVEAREREPWFDAGDLLLAERDGALLASAWTKVEPGADEGELYALGVDPDAQGLGLGRALTARVVAHLAGRGLRTATLYVEGDNAAATRTYQRAGFVRDRVDVQYG